MDWRKLRAFLTEKYGADRAYMFIGYLPENEDMYEQLHDSGYGVVLKPTFDMTRPRPEGDDKDDERQTKGNIDADLVLWAMKELKNYDKAVIVSGDGDFYTLVEYLAEQGKLLKLLAPNAHYSSLYNQFDQYVERLDHHRKELAYHDRKRHKKRS